MSIPHITDEELIRRYLNIKPVAKIGEVQYWLREYTLHELRHYPFFMSITLDKRKPVGEELSRHDYEDFRCIHSYGKYGLFNPSIAEILAQIPEEPLKYFTIDAFEIIDDPTNSGNIKKFREAMERGFHFSIVRLYIRPEP